MKIYISGPMKGKQCFNFESFFVAARMLKSFGFEVFNPAENDALKMFNGWKYSPDQYGNILLEDLNVINSKIDCMFMLHGWKESTGARIERDFAQAIGIPIVSEQRCIFQAIEGNQSSESIIEQSIRLATKF